MGGAAPAPCFGDVSVTRQWAALECHAREFRDIGLRELFEADPGRADRCTTTVGDLVVDWSRQVATDRTVELLLALADRAGVSERAAAMLAGEPVNTTEARAALHTALRAGPGAAATAGVDAVDVTAAARAELDRMAEFAQTLRAGRRLGVTGRPIRTVVSLGIGGSHLGPAMAHEALRAFRHRCLDCRFVSNIDPADAASVLVSGTGPTGGPDPAETLFIIVSKSFTTAETLANARLAKAWIEESLGGHAPARHFVAVTAAPERAADFGIASADTFAVWDWVGGRFSLASAASLSLMAAVGDARFGEMLAGMRAVDEHFAHQPLAASAPALMGLLAVWNRNFLGLPTRAVLPYSQRLRLLPAYLQQLQMESNGKQVRLDGSEVGYDTAPILWGAPGTDGQHSFHQLLHQGTTVVPADFIVFARPDIDTIGLPPAAHPAAAAGARNQNPREPARPGAGSHHEMLVANCFAQAEALAFGTEAQASPGRLGPHRRLPGNRPSTVIMAPELTPSTLGQLVALYEHEVVVQAAVWGINSFDQFGVEHGKRLANDIIDSLVHPSASPPIAQDPSTRSLIARYHRLRAKH